MESSQQAEAVESSQQDEEAALLKDALCSSPIKGGKLGQYELVAEARAEDNPVCTCSVHDLEASAGPSRT